MRACFCVWCVKCAKYLAFGTFSTPDGSALTILRPVSPMHESTREINQKPQNYHIRKLLLHKLLFLYTYKKWRIIYMIDTVGKMAYTCYLLSPLNY